MATPDPEILKIAFFINKWPHQSRAGGIERPALTLHLAVANRGHEVLVVTTSPDAMKKQTNEIVDKEPNTSGRTMRTRSQQKDVNANQGEGPTECRSKKRPNPVKFAVYTASGKRGKRGPKCATTLTIDVGEESEDCDRTANANQPDSVQPPVILEHSNAAETFVGSSKRRDYLKTRTVSQCRVVPESLFEERDISWQSIITNDNMWPFFNLNEVVYPELVREFYANLTYKCTEGWDNITVDSTVRFKKIKLNVNNLAEILQVPSDGDTTLIMKKEEQDKAYREAVRFAHIKGKSRHTLNNIGELSAENRLLHQIISFMVLPRSGAYSTVHRNDLILLVDILKGKSINLPHIILSQMVRTVKEKLKYSPYGSVLTKVFRHFDIRGTTCNESNDCVSYDGHILRLMGIDTDPITKKLVRLTEPAPTKKRSVASSVADVLDWQRTMDTKIDSIDKKVDRWGKKLEKKMDNLLSLVKSWAAEERAEDDEVEEDDEVDADDVSKEAGAEDEEAEGEDEEDEEEGEKGDEDEEDEAANREEDEEAEEAEGEEHEEDEEEGEEGDEDEGEEDANGQEDEEDGEEDEEDEDGEEDDDE